MAKQQIATNLVGKMIVPAVKVLTFNDDSLFNQLWKLKPNLSGHYFATIQAVYMTQDSNVGMLITGPMGDSRQIIFIDDMYDIFDTPACMERRDRQGRDH